MRAVIVYESMYGNTHTIADHIATGLGDTFDTTVVSAAGATANILVDAELLIVGGPTHVHGMSRTSSRAAAVTDADKHDSLTLDPDAEGPGLRDWFHHVGDGRHRTAAAFDTRYDASPALTGRASKGIAKRLVKHRFVLLGEPESFLVDKDNHLIAGEEQRAQAWGQTIARAASTVTADH